MLAVFVQVSVYYSDDNFTMMIMSKLPTTIPQLAVPEKKRIFLHTQLRFYYRIHKTRGPGFKHVNQHNVIIVRNDDKNIHK